MAKNTSFNGDLTDQERLRAKLEDIDAEIERQRAETDRLDDELSRINEAIEGLERVRDGLLVILGDKHPESDRAQFEREERETARQGQWAANLEQWKQHFGAATIQAQVENLVNARGREVSAGELLEHLPAGTKSEAVNYALWRAAKQGRIRKVSRGVYVANPSLPKTATSEGR
jgi:chromosome segregation ATPase